MMFTFHQSGVYTTRNAQMSFQKEVPYFRNTII